MSRVKGFSSHRRVNSGNSVVSRAADRRAWINNIACYFCVLIHECVTTCFVRHTQSFSRELSKHFEWSQIFFVTSASKIDVSRIRLRFKWHENHRRDACGCLCWAITRFMNVFYGEAKTIKVYQAIKTVWSIRSHAWSLNYVCRIFFGRRARKIRFCAAFGLWWIVNWNVFDFKRVRSSNGFVNNMLAQVERAILCKFNQTYFYLSWWFNSCLQMCKVYCVLLT